MNATRLNKKVAGMDMAAWTARANPLLIRHVRQELRNRGFFGVFLILVLAAALACVFAGAWVRDGGSTDAGARLFGLLTGAYTFALWLAQPLTAFRAMVRERDEDTWDLIDLTGMAPGRIIRGMILAGLVQGLLYTAAMVPFMLMAYLLRGIDLLTVAATVATTIAIGVALTVLAVFLACIGANKASRAFMNIILVMGLLGLWLMSWSVWGSFGNSFWGSLSMSITNEQVWVIIAAWVNVWLAAVVLGVVLSAALLTHRAGNRSTGPRLVWIGLLLNGFVWAAVGPWATGSSTNDFAEALSVAALIGQIWMAIYAIFALTEEYELTPRQARWFISGGRWRRTFAWLLGPGAARGRVGFLALGGLCLGLGWMTVLSRDDSFSRPSLDDMVAANAAVFAYATVYLLLWDGLARTVLARLCTTVAMRRTIVLLGLAAVSFLPSLAALLLGGGFDWLHLLNPVYGPVYALRPDHLDHGPDAALMLVLMHGVLLFGVMGLILQAVRHWRVTTQRVLARADDHNPRHD